MLILSRKVHERIMIGDNASITITGIQGGNVKIGLDFPHDVHIMREELIERDKNGGNHEDVF